MLGKHRIKTWSSTQGAVALSSAEAEFYAMIEATVRSKGMLSTMKEIGFRMTERVQLYTDSSAAKSFVSRRGLGKMKHLEIRDLWLQREVGLGLVVVNKVEGLRNPADLMTKYLKRWEIELRLRLMHKSGLGRRESTRRGEVRERSKFAWLGFGTRRSLLRTAVKEFINDIAQTSLA